MPVRARFLRRAVAAAAAMLLILGASSTIALASACPREAAVCCCCPHDTAVPDAPGGGPSLVRACCADVSEGNVASRTPSLAHGAAPDPLVAIARALPRPRWNAALELVTAPLPASPPPRALPTKTIKLLV
jgi:hypothetical protein